MKNKNGFTLVELVITIFIIGILTSASAVIFTKINKEQKQKLSDNNIKLIESAAVKYGEAHKKDIMNGTAVSYTDNGLSKINNDQAYVSYIDLDSLKYLGYLSGINDDTFDNEIKNKTFDNDNADTNIYLYIENNKVKAKYGEPIYNFDFEYDRSTKTITIINSDNDKDIKYTLFINNDPNSKDIKENTYEFSKDELNNGINFITIEKKDTNGITITKTKKINVLSENNESNKPSKELTCFKMYEYDNENNINEENIYYSDSWTNKNVAIKNECENDISYSYNNDNNKGIISKDGNIKFTESGTYEVNLTDENNEEVNYSSKAIIKIDKNPPTLTAEAYKSDKNNESTDQEHGYAIGENILNSNGTIQNLVNGWINSSNYNDGIAYKFKGIDQQSSIESVKWLTNEENTFDENTFDNCINNENECLINDYTNDVDANEYETYKLIDKDGYRYAKFILKDKAGNETTKIIKLKMDREKPSVENSSDSCITYNNKLYNQKTSFIIDENGSGINNNFSSLDYDYNYQDNILDIYSDFEDIVINICDKASNCNKKSVNALEKQTCKNNDKPTNLPLSCPKITSSISPNTTTDQDITFTFDFNNTNAESYNWQVKDLTNSNDWINYGNDNINNKERILSNNGNYQIKLIIYDKDGNQKECSDENNYTIDKKKTDVLKCPIISSSVAPEIWTNNNVTFTFDFKDTNVVSYDWYTQNNQEEFKKFDNNSLTDDSSLSKTISGEGKRKIKLIVYDKDGNTKECMNDNKVYYIDKTKPTLKVSGNEDWTNAKNVTVSVSKKTDTGGSGIKGCQRHIGTGSATGSDDPKKYQGQWLNDADCKYIVGAAGTSKVSMRVYDNAGNYSDYISKNIKIDRTKPTLKVSGNENWTNAKNVTVSVSKKTDTGGSGIKGCQRHIGTGSATGSDDPKKYQGQWLNDADCKYIVGAAGTSKVSMRVYDNAGNYSDYISKRIKIDRTAPKISYKKTNTYTTNGVTITVTGTDNESGIKSKYKSNTYENKKNGTYKNTVYDNAGNSKTGSISVKSQNQSCYQTRSDYYCYSVSKCGYTVKDLNAHNCTSLLGDYWEKTNSYTNPYEFRAGTRYVKIKDTMHCYKYGKGVNYVKIYGLYANKCWCGYSYWSGWSNWTTSSCTSNNYKKCAYRTRYY